MAERNLSTSRVNHAGAGTGLFPVNKVNTRTAWRYQDITWFIRRMFYKKCSGKSLKNSIENYIFIIITTYPGSNGLIWVSNECSLVKAPSSMNGCVVCCWGASWALFFPHNGIWSYFFQHNTGPFRLVDPASHTKQPYKITLHGVLLMEPEALFNIRADSRFPPSQWETVLQSNALSLAGCKPRISPEYHVRYLFFFFFFFSSEIS